MRETERKGERREWREVAKWLCHDSCRVTARPDLLLNPIQILIHLWQSHLAQFGAQLNSYRGPLDATSAMIASDGSDGSFRFGALRTFFAGRWLVAGCSLVSFVSRGARAFDCRFVFNRPSNASRRSSQRASHRAGRTSHRARSTYALADRAQLTRQKQAECACACVSSLSLSLLLTHSLYSYLSHSRAGDRQAKCCN